MTHFDTVPVVCVGCDEVFGFARLSGDERAVQATDTGGTEDAGGISVGGWEYGALIEPLCPACHLRERLIDAAADAYRNDTTIDGRALADEWGVPESVFADVVNANGDVVDWGVSPMVPFPHPDFDPDEVE